MNYYLNHIRTYRVQQIFKLIQSILAITFIVCLFFLPIFTYSLSADADSLTFNFSIFDEVKLIFEQLKFYNFILTDVKLCIALIFLISSSVILITKVVSHIVTIVNTIKNISTIDNSTFLLFEDVVMYNGKHLSNKTDLKQYIVAIAYFVGYYFVLAKLQISLIPQSTATSYTFNITNVTPLIYVVASLLALYLIISIIVAIFNRKLKVRILRDKNEEKELNRTSVMAS